MRMPFNLISELPYLPTQRSFGRARGQAHRSKCPHKNMFLFMNPLILPRITIATLSSRVAMTVNRAKAMVGAITLRITRQVGPKPITFRNSDLNPVASASRSVGASRPCLSDILGLESFPRDFASLEESSGQM